MAGCLWAAAPTFTFWTLLPVVKRLRMLEGKPHFPCLTLLSLQQPQPEARRRGTHLQKLDHNVGLDGPIAIPYEVAQAQQLVWGPQPVQVGPQVGHGLQQGGQPALVLRQVQVLSCLQSIKGRVSTSGGPRPAAGLAACDDPVAGTGFQQSARYHKDTLKQPCDSCCAEA